MSGLLKIGITEQRGFVAIPSDRANLAVVMGCSSLGTGLSPFYLSGAAAQTDIGYGDAVDDLTQTIEQRQKSANGAKKPAAFYTTPITTQGAYGTIDLTSVTGTAKAAAHTANKPNGTFEAWIKWVAAVTALGTAGGAYQWSLDGGRTYSNTTALGTASAITVPNSGVKIDLGTVLKGTTDVSSGALYGGGGTLDTLTLILNVNGGGSTTLTLNGAGNTANEAAFLAAIAAQWPALVATDSGASDGHKLVLTDVPGTTITVGAGTANTALGLTPGTYAGTFAIGDIIKIRTTPPQPSVADIDTAFTALANSGIDFGILVLGFDVDSTVFPHITTGLNALAARGKKPVVVTKARLPHFDSAETDAAWNTAIAADFVNLSDSRVHVRATYGLLTDAMTSRQYLRTDLAQTAADIARVGIYTYFGSPSDQPIANWSLVDATGKTVGHDEGERGASTGLSDDVLGNRFGCNQRLSDSGRREDVFNTVPWVMYAADEKIRNVMVRRVCNEMELDAVSLGTPKLGSVVFVKKTSNTTGILSDTSREAIHASMYEGLAGKYAPFIDNAGDAALDSGLVQVAKNVTVSGGNLSHIPFTIAPRFGDFVVDLPGTLAVQE